MDFDNMEIGEWLVHNNTPVTYLGLDEDGYVLYARGHISILATKASMFAK